MQFSALPVVLAVLAGLLALAACQGPDAGHALGDAAPDRKAGKRGVLGLGYPGLGYPGLYPGYADPLAPLGPLHGLGLPALGLPGHLLPGPPLAPKVAPALPAIAGLPYGPGPLPYGPLGPYGPVAKPGLPALPALPYGPLPGYPAHGLAPHGLPGHGVPLGPYGGPYGPYAGPFGYPYGFH